MDIKQKSLNALKWEVIGKIINPLIIFASTIILTRILLPENFGQLATIQLTVVILISLLDFGFGLVLIQKKEVDDVHFSSVFWLSLSFTVLISIIIIIFSNRISFLLFNSSELADYLKLVPVCLIFGVYINNQTFRLKREINFSKINISLIISNLLSSLIGIYLAIKNFGTWSLIIQLTLMYIFQGIILSFISKSKIKLKFNFQNIKEMWKIGKVLFLGNALEAIYFNLDSIIIGKIFTPSHLGYYNRAKTFDSLVINFTSGTLSFLLSAFSKMQDDLQKLKDAFIYVLNGLNTLVFLIIGVIYLCASDVVLIIFGPNWVNSIEYLEILILGSFAYPLGYLFVNIIVSRGDSKLFIKNEIIKRILLTLAFIIGFQFGIKGYLYSMVVLAFISTFLNAYFSCKSINVSLSEFFKNVYKYFVLTIILTIIFKLLDNSFFANPYIHFLIFGGGFTISYIFFLFLFRIYGFDVFKREITQIIQKYYVTRKNNEPIN